MKKSTVLISFLFLAGCSSSTHNMRSAGTENKTVQCKPGDDDGDGVDNCHDKCPDSKPGQYISSTGCSFELHDGMEDVLYFPRRGDMPNDDAATKRLLATTARIAIGHDIGFGIKLAIIGHADNCDDEKSNRRLSLRRAENVRQKLLALDVPADRIVSVTGEGSSQPRGDTPPCSNPFNDRVNLDVAELPEAKPR